jgi:hypothetical protein
MKNVTGNAEKQRAARCLTCNEVVLHDPRRIAGCGCDPDANTWVYIETDGRVRGLSGARWETL